MEISDFSGKPFPCPVCNMALRLKSSSKGKPYCMCLECGIQIFFRGQEGIKRLHKMIRSEDAVAAEFNGPARAISLYNRLQGLKRQRKGLEDQQGIIFRDSDRDKVIVALEAEIERGQTEEVLAGRIFISETLRRKLLKKDDQANPKGGTRLGPDAMEIALAQSGLLIARAETINWQSQRVPGCWIKPLLVEQQGKIATSLVRMDPGTHFPAHRHGGPEEVFLLEGDLVVEGQKMKPGDYCRAETGTIHSESYTESGCLFFLKASQLDEIVE